jgi:hypothetical protein
VIADAQEERVKQTARQLQEETGMPFVWVSGALSLPGVADAMAQRAVNKFGQVDTDCGAPENQKAVEDILNFLQHRLRVSL